MKEIASQTSCGAKVDTSSCGIADLPSRQASAAIVTPATAGVQEKPRSSWTSLNPRFRGNNEVKADLTTAISEESSKDEEDQEGNGKAEEAGRLCQREAEKREGLHLSLRRRVAGNRADQRREHVADADAGPDEGNARKACSDHFGRSEIHVIFRVSGGGWRR